jgi:UDP-glucuronate 4-epimerase
MAAYLFTRAIFANEPIKIFNNGNMWRDFTYVDDIVEGVIRTLDRPAVPNLAWNAEQPECSTSYAPYRVYNIGNNRSVNLIEFVETLEKIIGKPAIRQLLPMQAGDVLETRADISALQRDVGFAPSTLLADGLGRFVEWYRQYHRV